MSAILATEKKEVLSAYIDYLDKGIKAGLEIMEVKRDLVPKIPSQSFDQVDVWAFVTIEKNGADLHYLIVPGQAGDIFSCGELDVYTVATDAPIMSQIFKAKKGDCLQFGTIKDIQ